MQLEKRTSPGGWPAALLLAALAAAGCGSSSSTPSAPGPTAVGGNVSKAPISGAAVQVLVMGSAGTPGASVAGPFTTDANGDWTGSIAAGTSGPFVLAASGGSYVDEANASTVTLPAGRTLHGLLSGTHSQVTPFTHATFLGMVAQVAGGTSVADAIATARASGVSAFGFDFATTVPRNVATASASEKAYAALLGGVSTLLDNNAALSAFTNTPKFDLVLALSADMADGRLDGLDASGSAIDVPTDDTGTATAPMPALSATDLSALAAAANAYAAGQPALNGTQISATAGGWNPAQPPGPGGCAVGFSGPGASLLRNSCFVVSSATYDFDNQPHWVDEAGFVEILLVPTDSDPNQYRTIYVLQTESPNHIWNESLEGAIPGISRNPNGSVAFSNVSVPALTATMGPLILNGTLPAPPIP